MPPVVSEILELVRCFYSQNIPQAGPLNNYKMPTGEISLNLGTIDYYYLKWVFTGTIYENDFSIRHIFLDHIFRLV